MESLLITILAIPLIVAGIVWITPGNVKVTGLDQDVNNAIVSIKKIVSNNPIKIAFGPFVNLFLSNN